MDAFTLLLTHDRDTHFQLLHTQCIQPFCDGEFLFKRECHAGGLFAVSQGCVVKYNGRLAHAVDPVVSLILKVQSQCHAFYCYFSTPWRFTTLSTDNLVAHIVANATANPSSHFGA